MELVEDDCIDALEIWIGQQPAGKDTLRDESEARARSDLLLKTDLVANRSTDLFAQLPRDPSRRQARRDPAGFEHDDFAADETENGRWNPGRLPGSRRGFDDEAGRVLQGRKHLRQNRIHRKCWPSTHCVDRNTAFPGPSMGLQRPYRPTFIPAAGALLSFLFL